MGTASNFLVIGARAAVLAAAFACGAPIPCAMASSTSASGSGPHGTTAAIDISIKVPKVMRLRLIGHPAVVEVTDTDVKQGRVTVIGASLDMVANDRRGYLLQAQLSSAVFTAVRIGHLQSECAASAEGCTVRMPSMVGKARPGPMPVTYELKLAANAAPGRYAWPVALSLQDP